MCALRYLLVVATSISFCLASSGDEDAESVSIDSKTTPNKLLKARVPEFELIGIDFFMTVLKQLAALAMVIFCIVLIGNIQLEILIMYL